MAWGISNNASEKEKIKSKMADYLNGLNSVGDISYKTYSDIFDFSMDLMDEIYEKGNEDGYEEARYNFE